jgi:uncharacterized coiled-coil protein SlyX
VRDLVEKRLGELKAELASEENHLAELTARQAALRRTVQRLQGAIDVLEELLARGEATSPSPGP